MLQHLYAHFSFTVAAPSSLVVHVRNAHNYVASNITWRRCATAQQKCSPLINVWYHAIEKGTMQQQYLDFFLSVVLGNSGFGLLKVSSSPVPEEVREAAGGDVVHVEHASQDGPPLFPHHLSQLLMETR
jgi:hypothetical protein